MNRYDIGRRIELYRDKLGISTQELAERINRSQATISRIENGKQGLTFELLSRIASELRIHPFALLSDEPLRFSVLMPAGGKDGEYATTLLANALHAGRVRRKLRVDTAACLVGIPSTELESVEMALSRPEDALLEKLCVLYGLPLAEMLELKRFGSSAPEMDRSLAVLQQAFSRIYHLAKNTEHGDEPKALHRIIQLLDKAGVDNEMQLESTGEDIGLFLNRLSLHLVKALKDKDFRDSMFQLAGLNEDKRAE